MAPTAARPPQGEQGAQGGPQGGFGGGSFDVDAFTVLGIDPSASAVGPLSAVTLSDGRTLTSDDAGADVAVLDATYASTADLAVGDTIDVGGTAMEVVGIVTSTSSSADTAANVYIPLDVAQTISGVGDVVSTVYVQAESADQIATVQADIQAALPDATVSSQSDLASTVSGSLSSASSLITNLGTWLSLIVLAVAVVLAVLFTISGRLASHPRVRHPQGDRLVERPRRRPGRRRVGRPGADRRCRRARRGSGRHLGDQPRLADDLVRADRRRRADRARAVQAAEVRRRRQRSRSRRRMSSSTHR